MKLTSLVDGWRWGEMTGYR